MAIKVPASFLKSEELLFIGYSRKNAAYCKSVREAFESCGTRVFPVNPNRGDFDVPVFAHLDEVSAKPELAYVLTSRARNDGLPAQLAARGVKRVLFNSKLSADAALIAECERLGMRTAVACPLMSLGKGMHRFHGWLAGVERADAAR